MSKKYYTYLIVTLIILLSLSSYYYFTYAKYITSINSDTEINVAKWNIKLNNQNISSETQMTNIITPIFEGTEHIAEGIIAPTAEGYFDLVLDATDTDVSLKYEITTSNNEDSSVTDLIISGYSINNGERQNIEATEDNSNLKIENNILKNDTNKIVNLRVYIKWNDDAENGATMTNADDTNATKEGNNTAIINVNVRVIQLPNT